MHNIVLHISIYLFPWLQVLCHLSHTKLIDNTTTMRYLSNLNLSHRCGHDNLSTVILKYIANEISECLTLIINQSITTGMFPDQLKIAKVVPIFKKDDQAQIKNYRPISVLPVI